MNTWALLYRIAVAVIAFVAMVLAVVFGSGYATRFYLAENADGGKSMLGLTVVSLEGALRRYDYLPTLLARDAEIGRLLGEAEPSRARAGANPHLNRIARETGLSEIYLIAASGNLVATANGRSGNQSPERTLSQLPFFSIAMSGKTGTYFDLQPADNRRSYYYAAPVRRGDGIAGVVAVKVDLEGLERTWDGPVHEILVADTNGIVFLSSKPEWRFRSLEPLTKATMTAIRETGQYGGLALSPLDLRPVSGSPWPLVAIQEADSRSVYLSQSTRVPTTGWRVIVLSKTEAASNQAAVFTIIAALVLLILIMFLVFLWQRRARLIERIALQHEAREVLERRVDERTASLNEANRRLVREISERKATESELRKTQEDLIQAGKLAALGQMSAALSHEFNQPLAAIRSYADNADVLLERDRTEEARDNVSRISALTDRMAAISKHLRNFARKPGEKVDAVSLLAVISDTIELLEGRLRNAGATVDVNGPDAVVAAGHIRLQQVLVNLVTNALDAMEGLGSPLVEITILSDVEADFVELSVRDHGAGVEPGAADKVFDPFFTTKGVGKGLGLGLSISYNIIKDFGGGLRVANHPDGGAVFSARLKRADASDRSGGSDAEDRIPLVDLGKGNAAA
ncbi:MAG: ATP-binding protein [Pseudomonadota bacterium]